MCKYIKCWYLLEKALARGCTVDIQIDVLGSSPREVIRKKIQSLEETCPETFSYKEGRQKGGGMRHTKIYASPRWIITGSFNMSQEAREINQECAVVSNDQKLVKAQHDFLDKISL